MQSEVTQLIADYLKDTTNGVAVLLPEVGRTVLGQVDPDPMPRAFEIYDDVRTESLAQTLDQPPSFPAIVVMTDADATIDADSRRPKGDPFTVAIMWITDTVEPMLARREGSYVMRAVRRAINRYNHQPFSNGYRELNGIKILEVKSVTVQTVAGGIGGSPMTGFLLANVRAMDTQPD